jgi:hypothetical protein
MHRQSNPSFSNLSDFEMKSLSQVVSSIGKVQDVTQFLDDKGCCCINDLSPSSFDGFLNGRKLISGKGSGKLVLVYSFKQKLMVKITNGNILQFYIYDRLLILNQRMNRASCSFTPLKSKLEVTLDLRPFESLPITHSYWISTWARISFHPSKWCKFYKNASSNSISYLTFIANFVFQSKS